MVYKLGQTFIRCQSDKITAPYRRFFIHELNCLNKKALLTKEDPRFEISNTPVCYLILANCLSVIKAHPAVIASLKESICQKSQGAK
jgi:hypothetical protein